jgi:hypothetical protein
MSAMHLKNISEKFTQFDQAVVPVYIDQCISKNALINTHMHVCIYVSDEEA